MVFIIFLLFFIIFLLALMLPYDCAFYHAPSYIPYQLSWPLQAVAKSNFDDFRVKNILIIIIIIIFFVFLYYYNMQKNDILLKSDLLGVTKL